MSHSHITSVTWIIPPWHVPFRCDMTQSYVQDALTNSEFGLIFLLEGWYSTAFSNVTRACLGLIPLWRFSFLRDMTHSYVTRLILKWHDSSLCSILEGMAIESNLMPLQHTATHCNTLQHTATHCNTLQHTATRCNTLQHTPTCSILMPYATHSPVMWLIPTRSDMTWLTPTYQRTGLLNH